MYKCLRVLIKGSLPDGFLKKFVQLQAKKCDLEGAAQIISGEAKHASIIVCGDRDNVDEFLDALHVYSAKNNINDIEIEPFLKDKDYRGVFRVIE